MSLVIRISIILSSLSKVVLRHIRRESEPYCHSILFVCLDVCRSFRDLQPTTIDDHNQIWSASIYLSSDPCKPFWIPYLPYFRCQREKCAKFRLFRRLTLRRCCCNSSKVGLCTVGRASGRCWQHSGSSSQARLRKVRPSEAVFKPYSLVSRLFLPLRR